MQSLLKKLENLNSAKIHTIFFSLLSLNYIISLLFLGNFSLFYHDGLDHEIVFNKVIGEFYRGNWDSLKIFLAGEIKFEFLRRILHPIILLYSIFNSEIAYWITDILVKIISYFSFYILSKKILVNKFYSGLSAVLYASINFPTHESLGPAILPYVFYLSAFKENLKFKNYFILIFCGLNSDFISTFFSLPFLALTLIILFKKINKINFLKVFTIFIICILISNLNLIFGAINKDILLHRTEFIREGKDLLDLIFSYLIFVGRVPNFQSFDTALVLPITVFLIPALIISLISKSRKLLNILFLVCLVKLLIILLDTHFFANLYNNSQGLIRTINIAYIKTILPFLYSLLAVYIFKTTKFNHSFFVIIIFSVFLSQIKSTAVPVYKGYNSDNNLYTFKGFYKYEDYGKIKSKVGKARVISVGLEPMIAVMNEISVIDGYHNIYPLSYKKKFRKIIKSELDKDPQLKKNYDNWGSRVYAFVSDSENIELDFKAAKNLGANFVISKFKLKSENIALINLDFKNEIYLYEIQN